MTIHWHQELPSTMDAAHRLADAGAAHGTAVAAHLQFAGRGRRGRLWHSDEGGLWLSVVCRPAEDQPAGCLSLRVGLAVARVLESCHPALPMIGIKWPNDLVLVHRKVGGVLCEGRWDASVPLWVVVGVGINVRNALPPHLTETAIALSELVADADPTALAEPIAEAVAHASLVAGPLRDQDAREFARRDWLHGRLLTAPVAGAADGVEPDGALRITEPGGGTIRVAAGAVVLADA